MQRLAGFILIIALLAVAWRSTTPYPAVAGTASPAAANARTPEAALQLQGVASCASSGCHHGNGPRGARGSEYTTWLVHDSHSRAYEVLLSERSRTIERNLKHLPDGKEVHPEASALCLHCHVQPFVFRAPRAPRFSLQDGVGCESCHGPAEKWLGPHQTWKALSLDDKKRAYEAHGMTWLKDLGGRAQICADCHIGSADADVNHDLIAAGHPRLRFEYAAYLALMPRHAPADADQRRHPDFAARAWAIGQVVSTRTALDLLAARAETAARPWPEFAEYDCYACHHNLGRPSRQRQTGLAGRAPGLLPWGEWYGVLLPHVFAFQPDADSAEVRSAMIVLKQEMQKPLPDRARVGKQARNAAAQLSPWLSRLDQVKFDNPVLLHRLLGSLETEARPPALRWDAEGQRFLGMSALYRALQDREPTAPEPQWRDYLQALGGQLQFPNGFDSPREDKIP